MATNKLFMKFASIGVPTLMLGSGGYFWNKKRNEYLSDPVLNRALKHLKKDRRVSDFCGDNIEPGWIITRNKRPGENWVKYEMTIKGASGKLQAKVIGDYLTHQDFTVLELERQKHTGEDIDYVPVDFDAYSIVDQNKKTEKGPLSNDERIYRISSLTAAVDDETKILVLPLPESKRSVKIADTKYTQNTIEKLL